MTFLAKPFVGGGGMFFSILSKFNFKKKIISDINAELINVYNKEYLHIFKRYCLSIQ